MASNGMNDINGLIGTCDMCSVVIEPIPGILGKGV